MSKLDTPDWISRRNLLIWAIGALCTRDSIAWSVNKILTSTLKNTINLSDDYFENAENLLERIRINPSSEFTIAMIREEGSRVFAIKINYSDIEKLSKNWWTYTRWMLTFEIKKWGFINDFIIRGRKNGWLYRYGVIGFKDSEWVTLLDEKEDNMFFGREKEVHWQPPVLIPAEETQSEKPNETKQILVGWFRKKPTQLWYRAINPEWIISSSHLPDKESVKWRVIRSMRWKNITHAVEERYSIPSWLLLAMMAQEWYGDPTLPNLGGDGGLWLIHIQAANAYQFWLKTLPRFTNRMRDRRHGALISQKLAEHNKDLQKLIYEDDRWHPILAVDVAGRFLMEWYKRAKKKNPWVSELEVWNLALRYYSWRPYDGKRWYGAKVRAYQAVIMSPSYQAWLKKEFNSFGVKINNKPASFDWYMSHFGKMAQNYEIDTYSKLGKYKA